MAEKTSKIVSLDKQKEQLNIAAFELANKLVFEYFNTKVAEEKYDETLLSAIYIGILAMQEDRIAAFFAKTENELGTHLESLKTIFKLKQEVFFKTAVKGMAAEGAIVDFLKDFFKRRGYEDTAEQSGTAAGAIPGNKTGDILCRVEGSKNACDIAIEVKFDKSYKWGDIRDKDVFIKKADTAWSQILEAKANRQSRVGIIVFDRNLVDKSITDQVENAGFVKGVGFVAIVNSPGSDYTNLAIVYDLARDLALAETTYNAENDTLVLLVKRLLHDIDAMLAVTKQCDAIDKANAAIRETLKKNLLSFDFTKRYLEKFLREGKLNSGDLFAFYNAEEIKDKFKALDLEEILKKHRQAIEKHKNDKAAAAEQGSAADTEAADQTGEGNSGNEN